VILAAEVRLEVGPDCESECRRAVLDSDWTTDRRENRLVDGRPASYRTGTFRLGLSLGDCRLVSTPTHLGERALGLISWRLRGARSRNTCSG
jgi:hypothetical protein